MCLATGLTNRHSRQEPVRFLALLSDVVYVIIHRTECTECRYVYQYINSKKGPCSSSPARPELACCAPPNIGEFLSSLVIYYITETLSPSFPLSWLSLLYILFLSSFLFLLSSSNCDLSSFWPRLPSLHSPEWRIFSSSPPFIPITSRRGRARTTPRTCTTCVPT